MSTPDMKKAREWADWTVNQEVSDGVRAAVNTIHSLPDQFIDAEKVKELIDIYTHARNANGKGTEGWMMNHLVVSNLESLLPVPSLQTLAELIEQGNDPQQYQWMQCYDDPGYVIVQVGETVSRVLLSDGNHVVRGNSEITPLTDEPKLEWPSLSVSEESEVVEDDEPVMVPRPEDVPPGKPWIVKYDGHKWVGTRDSTNKANWPWVLARLDGVNCCVARDSEISLISRLVPEVSRG